ncbi:MAG: putative DNA binding domain-containing protein [Defluviicoccus sp.]|uniref:RNA-binding domain-containing protein n=1 Tax=Accumulibacter sp. TaxID=2053492 RepID=UPI0025F0F08B|nr:RNA-binding domain-containing protein [Accumulibacter sp.]MCM8626699.1 putative DNA binding domain-containing protein [Accumulibacter sp.]MDG4574437.1 putative DNA binding domain-containing protein [Defluviicoccus sp.]MDG4591485.1 putative DNA binding domain-containing protein [Defluviicoccus sp.]
MRLSRSELLARIQGGEWSDLEVKAAQHEVPKSAYETVSAFANTSGGHLVFGVQQSGDQFEIVGVISLDKVQNDFLSGLRSTQKISYQIATTEDIIETETGRLLVFYVPEAPRQHKPVYLNGDIRRSFIRRGAADHRCDENDIRRFLRAAGGQSYESESIDLDIESCIDGETLARYRRRFEARDQGNRCNDFDAAHFLEHWALAVQAGGTLRPTRAAILLFGTGAALRAMLPRPVVDCRWAVHAWDAPAPDQRWVDRLVCEDNLWTCWEQLADRYVQNAAKPFALEVATMERQERPEDFVSFREAAINLLMHQDFEEGTRSAMISFHPDRVVFENPGTARASTSALLEPGEKDVRNPRIIGMFRRVGLSEQAGTGLSAIFGDWRRRGRVPPEIVNDVASYTFRLSLLVKELLSERQLLFQAALGVHLSDQEATALAILCGQPQVYLPEFRASLGIGSAELMPILNRLEAQVLATKSECPDGVCYQLSEHLRQRWPLAETPGTAASLVSDQAAPESTNLVSDQAVAKPGRQLDHLTDEQYRLLAACDTPRQLTELMDLLGVKHRTQFRSFHLRPLLNGGLLQLQFPDAPRHPSQRYSLTAVGAEIVARHIKAEGSDR